MPPLDTNQINQNQQIYQSNNLSKVKPFWKNKSVILICLIIFSIVCIFGILIFKQQSQLQVSETFIKYLQNDKPVQSYQLTSASFKSLNPSSQWSTMVKEISNNCPGVIQKNSNIIKDGVYYEKFIIKGGVPPYCEINLSLVKNSNSWKIDFVYESPAN